MSNIYEKLLTIQTDLKAPKVQINKFGNYKYRSCEDILEAVKPLCLKYATVLTINDEMVQIGERYYIKAVATLDDTNKAEGKTRGMIQNTAYAREEEIKKGMDASQITGACSSYARKYALNGLFCIDDTKDADTDAYKKQQDEGKPITISDEDFEEIQDKLVTEKEVQMLKKLLFAGSPEATTRNITGIVSKYNKFKLEELLMTEYVAIIHYIEDLKKKQKENMKGVL